MKKIAFVAVLIAAIVGIVFGGLSVAGATAHRELGPTDTPHPTCTPRPTPTPCCVTALDKIDALSTQVTNLQTQLANVTMMETLASGEVDIWSDGVVVQKTYPGVRHVSLTISGSYLKGELDVKVPLWAGYTPVLTVKSPHDEYVYTCQFDASSWEIYATVPQGQGEGIEYWATVTYSPGN